MTSPIAVTVIRYQCPHCGRTRAHKRAAVAHIARCWLNPAARGCKTCRHFDAYGPDYTESCGVGVDLSGRPECADCHGTGGNTIRFADDARLCPTCGGDGEVIKPGPITGCGKWEAVS